MLATADSILPTAAIKILKIKTKMPIKTRQKRSTWTQTHAQNANQFAARAMLRSFQRLQIRLHFFLQPVGAIRTSGFPNRIPIARKKEKQPFR
jgi:hypothetical protein